jgi:superfamily I DNA/RNA helicase
MTLTYNPTTGTITGATESKWFVPEDRLNPDQQRFLREVNINQQNIWIKGFAGSGKSILLVHVAKKILAAKPNAKIVLIVYTQSLVEMFKKALRELNPPINIPVITFYSFMASSSSYEYILCDEVQDLTPRVLSKMYERSAHVVVAGDSNQSIYAEDPKWRERTVEVSQIPSLIHGSDFELTIVERLTESIMKAVKSFLSLNIFGTRVNLNKVDTKISLCEANSNDSEISFVIQNSTRVVQRGYTAAILIPTQKGIVEFVNKALSSQGKPTWNSQTNEYGKVDFGAMNSHLKSCGINLQYIGNGYGEFRSNPDYVVLMTYHSAKGLDFDYVYIPFCNDYLWISYNETLSKTLFMVAMTRARMNLYITYTGSLHSYVRPFKDDCSKRQI